MPPAKKRRSPLDRFTDASPTAISAGFSAAMSLGPQPKPFGSASSGVGEGLTGGIDKEGDESWVQSMRDASGFAGAGVDDGSDDDGSEVDVIGRVPTKRKTPRRKRTNDDNDDGGEEEQARNRKAQNRIAQREFRQRKQQYIRALEARVELLSSDHDTQVDRLRHALRGLLAENNTLRSMLGSLARFIGEGMLGGPLQQTGVSRPELLEMINGRSEKTMTDAWQNWPGAKECEALRQIRQEANIPPEGLPDMRSSPGPSSGAASGSANKKGKKNQQTSTSSGAGTANESPANTAGGQVMPTAPNLSDAGGLSFDNNGTSNQLQGFLTTTDFAFPSQPLSQQQQQQQSQQDQDALMAGMFTSDNFYDGFSLPGSATQPSFMGHSGVFEDLQAQQQRNASSFSLDALGGSVGTPPQLAGMTSRGMTATMGAPTGGNGPGSANASIAGSSSPAASSAAATPRTAFENSAMQFLSSLRSVEKNDDVQRLNVIGARLNRLRAAQGQPEFHPFGPGIEDVPALNSDEGGDYRATELGGPMTEEEMNRMTDACIQVSYHLSNYRKNASYRLPALLRPTDLQLTRPHDPIVDLIPFAGCRDAIILHQDRINVDELMFHFFNALLVSDGDVFNPTTWMLNHSFVARYTLLATNDVMEATNRWRRKRGLEDLSMDEVRKASEAAAVAVAANSNNTTSGNGNAATATATTSAGPGRPGAKPRGRPRKSSPRYRPPNSNKTASS